MGPVEFFSDPKAGLKQFLSELKGVLSPIGDFFPSTGTTAPTAPTTLSPMNSDKQKNTACNNTLRDVLNSHPEGAQMRNIIIEVATEVSGCDGTPAHVAQARQEGSSRGGSR